MGSVAVRATGLRRVFQSRPRDPVVTALDGIDLAVPEGEIHGVLGPNGAGKTTLVKVLTTVILPTSGTADVCGFDVVEETREVRPLIGIVFGGEQGLYGRLSARENLEYAGVLAKLDIRTARRRADELLGRVGLAGREDEPVERFSRGMKQRVHLARGLMADPRVLFLDEPTTGMDPVASHEFRRLVTSLRDEGRTILLTTHDMAEAEQICDRVTLIDRGTILATEQPRELSRLLSRYERVDAVVADGALRDRLAALAGVRGVEALADGRLRIETDEEGAAIRVLEVLVGAGISEVVTSLPSLEEVYLHHFGARGLDV